MESGSGERVHNRPKTLQVHPRDVCGIELGAAGVMDNGRTRAEGGGGAQDDQIRSQTLQGQPTDKGREGELDRYDTRTT